MFTRIIQLLQKNRIRKVLFLTLCFTLLSLYPIYKNYYYGRANLQYDRHIEFLEKKSSFFNPWQYRIFCPLLIEGAYKCYNETIDRFLPIEESIVRLSLPEGSAPKGETREFIENFKIPGFVKYQLIFICFRFLLNLGILFLGYILLSYFIKNNWLIFFGLIFISFTLGNAVNDSDLAFNTYLDINLYLLAAIVVVYKQNPWWIVVITLIGSLNRETSLLIPYLFFVSTIDINRLFTLPSKNTIVITSISVLIFITVFVLVRNYYGWEEQTVWKVPRGLPMLKLNLFSLISIKSYFEMIGAFSVLPFICLYCFNRASTLLKIWFVTLVPIWFIVHWYSVVAYQSRLFLVPMIIVFLPIVLEIIDKYPPAKTTNLLGEKRES